MCSVRAGAPPPQGEAGKLGVAVTAFGTFRFSKARMTMIALGLAAAAALNFGVSAPAVW